SQPSRICVFVFHCIAATLLPLTALAGQEVQWPGLKPDGSMLLPNQWTLKPAGEHIGLDDFPVNIAVHPKGTFAAVLHCGYSTNEIVMVNLPDRKVVSRSDVPEAFYGITFNGDGTKLYCSGASGEEIFVFDCADGKLSNRHSLVLRDATEIGLPSGLALDSSGRTLFVANLWNDQVSRINLR